MRVAEVRQFCKLDEAGESQIRRAMKQLDLSDWEYPRSAILTLMGFMNVFPTSEPDLILSGPGRQFRRPI